LQFGKRLIQSTNEIGPELITNGDFSNGSTRWSLTNFSIINEKAVIDSSSPGYLIQTSVTEIGKTYRVEFTVSDYVEGRLRLRTPFINNDLESNPENGTYVYYGVADDTSFQIQSRFNGEDYKYKIDNVSVKEVTTATNTPRLDYSTGAEAFLLEPQSTNLITQSELFSDASWLRVGSITTTDNYTTSPSGQNNATRLQWTNATNYIYQSLSHVGNDFTLSIYLKSNTDVSQSVRLFMDNGAQAQDVIVTTQWQRFEFTNTTTPTQSNRNVGLIKSGGQVGDLDISIWGAQFEALSYPTSLIPTSGTTVTRNQETCINATPEINSEEGVLYAEISALANDGTSRVISISDGTNSHRVLLSYTPTTNQIQGFHNNGVDVINLTFVISDVTNFHKLAFKYSLNDFALWVDGVEVATNFSGTTNIPNTLNKLKFENASGSSDFFGNTKDVQVYTKALSDAELIKLTT
jgi:hypothetical protein